MKLNYQKFAYQISTITLIFFIGFFVAYKRLFPYDHLNKTFNGITQILKGNIRHHLCEINPKRDTTDFIYKSDLDSTEQLFLISYVDEELVNHIKLIANDGKLINQWEIDNLLTQFIEGEEGFNKNNAGRIHVSGIILRSNGDILLNVVGNGIFCLKWSGKIKWAKDYKTHHSLHCDKYGNIWTCLYDNNDFALKNSLFFNDKAMDDFILELDSLGNFMKKWSVTSLLLKNKYDGIINQNQHEEDRYHINDVETYDLSSKGFFNKNDVMISLRNLNTIFVFDQTTDSIKWMSTGRFHRQHDPDFIDSKNIILFDNKYLNYSTETIYSRIVKINANENSIHNLYGGEEKQGFFTSTLGKQELTKNGNILFTSSHEGKIFKVSPKGEILWVLTNYTEDKSLKTVVIEASVIERDYLKFNINK